jgi:hypothetical protein
LTASAGSPSFTHRMNSSAATNRASMGMMIIMIHRAGMGA